jgi:hypothetical protein
MKQVEWLAPERIIPSCGVATTGQLITLPTELADKFIAQGEARVPVPTIKKSTKEVEV